MPSKNQVSCDEIALFFAHLTLKAGQEVLSFYGTHVPTRRKKDRSIVSLADEKCEAFLIERLHATWPHIPIIAEEAVSRGEIPTIDSIFLLIDPIDGTKEFLNQTGEFTINIALIEAGIPRIGVIYAPAISQMWLGGGGAFTAEIAAGENKLKKEQLRRICTRESPEEGMILLRGRSQMNHPLPKMVENLPIQTERIVGSSYKFCLIAQGDADLYTREGRMMEWDTAAGDAILRGAGGGLINIETNSLMTYGRPMHDFKSPPFIAWGRVPEPPPTGSLDRPLM